MSYKQMSMPCMEISRSTQVASTAERPDDDVALCRIPNKEIVGRILLAYMTMSSEYRSKGRDRRLENGKGNLSIPNKMAYGEFTAELLRSKHRIFSNF